MICSECWVEGIERAELLGLEQEEPFLKAETALFERMERKYTRVSERSDVQKQFRNFFRDIAWKVERSAKIWLRRL